MEQVGLLVLAITPHNPTTTITTTTTSLLLHILLNLKAPIKVTTAVVPTITASSKMESNYSNLNQHMVARTRTSLPQVHHQARAMASCDRILGDGGTKRIKEWSWNRYGVYGLQHIRSMDLRWDTSYANGFNVQF
jgi:hypothetical protein